MHRWCKFGENVSNTLQNIVLTMFQDAHIDARTHRQKQYASGHIMLGGSTKIEIKNIKVVLAVVEQVSNHAQ